ncbi:N-acetylmuramoyl-L-alanine amidase [Xanthomonas phaseoli pv. phaseoli]|uniref:N-acetylmuramoyl-L-alanine amidase AmiC n=1 Tax=Xanthomonas campestris pv. phaseoli TaxID=317013 RepID=A0AB38DXH6_XANCH|nr:MULTISPECIES: N-acetylmuramoyl-L-alanine amidase [Xanthomonas]ATS21047.1 N-acetylmuramoyl-L-alanine amidase [Xanthomonas phaseoli pv. phaseoli]ATS27720.1 N-acetylmuramoyl-L-alanine amidase [Xanthomonas phaseoli pv. phaseoli]ATS31540.1 N-acetylmuramoyl-L-alanine amidase [Xanthomonas phaseoli pv. phaseoli]ATS35956.1 N-acetylmuramoyl-L-alanine amidase [Xanthomonas phaseoli pv. phaseoli]AZU12877.1 N-acetylmuramoyl-L-alanine amidase [Xanthomonas phaseoli pv. phaseoli]
MRRRQVLCTVGAALVLSPGLVHAQPLPRLRRYNLQRQDGRLRLRFALSTQVAYRSFTLSDPARSVIDLSGISAQPQQMDPVPEDLAVAGIRSGPHGDELRVVLDLLQPLTVAAPWEDSVLVFELVAGSGIVSLSAADPAVAADAFTRSRLHPYVVAIDAGHDGKDPGAVSADARYEKHVAMAIAARLHQRLAADTRYRPTMIRSDDRFVPLHERVLIAHRHNADLFVSIHADAAPTRQARGASVFALSQTGASSALARWIADSENAADDMGDTARRLRVPSNPVLSQVLADLSLSGTIASSVALGTLMLERLQQVTRLHQDQVGQAGFAVLKSPDIPSLLVETGFMSNRDDCSRLCSDTHQDELAQTLHAGIDDYFAAFPGRA